jgi:cytochrome c-type biogenesis protein CcmH
MVMGWFIASAILMVGVALALLLPPLLRQHDGARTQRELLQRAHAAGVLSDSELSAKLAALPAAGPAAGNSVRRWGLGLAFVVPLSVAALYSAIGTPDGLSVPVAAATSPHSGTEAGNTAMADATRGLAERLAKQPDDRDGWLLLARAYKVMEKYDDALAALDTAAQRWPDDTDILGERAGLLVLRDPQQRVTPEAEKLVNQVLAKAPADPQANWLKGMAAYQSGVFADAVARWQPLLDTMSPDTEGRDMLVAQINDARERAGMPLLPTAVPNAAAAPTAAAPVSAGEASPASTGPGPRLRVRVEIDPALQARLQPSDVLFVSARASNGPRIPLAARRISPIELPLELELSDADAMAPQFRLSTVNEVIVSARISRTGIANSAPGDFEAPPHTTATSATEPFTLRIERVVE